MNADHFFTIGKPHINQGGPCEDYALSGKQGDLCFGVISDGCGGAYVVNAEGEREHADTDVGSRVVAAAFRAEVAALGNPEGPWLNPSFLDGFLARLAASQYTGRPEDHYATLVGLVATPERAQAVIFGDGAIAVRYADGRRLLIEAEWQNNAPFYPAYRLSPAAYARFRSELHDSEPHFTLKRTLVAPGGEGIAVTELGTTAYAITDLYSGLVLDFAPAAEGIEAIAVLSDGVTKVGDYPPALAAADFLAFKVTLGGFVKRRLIRGLDTFAKAGHVLQDDLSMACIWSGKN